MIWPLAGAAIGLVSIVTAATLDERKRAKMQDGPGRVALMAKLPLAALRVVFGVFSLVMLGAAIFSLTRG